jgi:ribosomal protein S18 acetylase RimI-like enzyme
VVAVRWLEPDVAEDLALAPAVVDVVNRAYAHTEVGLFATEIERTDIDDVRTSISRRETAVALLEREVVGSVRARALDGQTGWFGALGVDPAAHGRGFGEALVRFVEDDATAAGRGAMQLEVLES